MADSKRTLPAIAIGLAMVAVIMVGLAIYVRTRRTATAPADAASDAVRRAFSHPDAGPTADPPPPPPPPDVPAQTGSGCVPCDESCRTSCTCRDGTFKTSFRCVGGCCERSTCDDSCASNGGPR